MTDTGQVPGEGLPEHAGGQQEGSDYPAASGSVGAEQPGYAFHDHGAVVPGEEDQLLMPGAQGSWSDQSMGYQMPPAYHQEAVYPQEMGYPSHNAAYEHDAAYLQAAGYPQAAVPGVAVLGGDHGAPAEQAVPEQSFAPEQPVQQEQPFAAEQPAPLVQPVAQVPPARRPLHLGPPVPDSTGGVVRSLSDRGPAHPTPPPVRHAGPPTLGPEYLDVQQAQQSAQHFPSGAGEFTAPQPGDPQSGSLPGQPAAWTPEQAEQPLPDAGLPAPDAESVPPAEQPLPVGTDAGFAPEPQHAPVGDPFTPPVDAADVQQPMDAASVDAQQPMEAVTADVMPAGEADVHPADSAGVAEQYDDLPGHTGESGVAAVPAEPVAVALPEPEPEAVTAAVPEPEAVTEAVPESEPEAVVAEPEQMTDAAPELAPANTEPESEPESAEAVADADEPSVAVEAVPAEPSEQAEPAVAEEQVPDEQPEFQPEPETAAEPAAEPAPVAQAEADAAEQPEAADRADAQPDPEAPSDPEAAADPEDQPEAEPGSGNELEPASGADVAEAQEGEPEDPNTVDGVLADSQDAPEAVEAGPGGEERPRALGYGDAEREAVMRVIRERRDIRNGFRPDPVPHDVLLRVLEAAHTAPSVGHSQPWDFVVIRSAETRRAMHELAARQREAYAKSLPKGRAKQFKALKVEAILDTPVNIVVTADPTRGGRHTLGRHTQPQMAPYSSALAVENLWLAARAEGLGVGWVSFFDEREMVRELGLPEHLEVVAYLCVGYVDEFPDEPELMQSGWSKRRPLSWVVHEETYGRRALPGEDPHDLLAETLQGIRPLDAKALGEAWERQKRMTKPAGALGMLEIISAQLCGLSRKCPPPVPEPAAVAVFAGDHGVHAQGVTPWPQEVTAQMVANFLEGGAVCNAFASQVGAEVCVVDVGVATELPGRPGLLPRKVRPGTGDFTEGPALSREEVMRAIEVGIETARDLVAAGNKALVTGEMGIANTTVSAALISVYTGMDPAEVTGRGTGINDEMHARKVDIVRKALELHQPDPADPIGVLAAVGGLEHAALVGLLLGGASMRTPVILDGVSAGAAALVARAIAPEALAACIAGHRSAEPGHVAALTKLGLRPLIDLDLRLGEGTGALLALPIVQSAARAMHEVATFDSAGVTEKN